MGGKKDDAKGGKDAGHRRRLREKFLEHGLDKFTDDEIVELLLTLATPRKDCKPMARSALEKFGSLAGVLDGSLEDLQRVSGIGPSNAMGIHLVQSIARKFLREKIISENYMDSFGDVLDYFNHALRGQRHESLHILFLDSQNAVLCEERLSTGVPNHVALYPRQILEKALKSAATSMVIAHNHPGGAPEPSAQDVKLTRQLYFSSRFLDMWIREHLIISTNGYYSFMREGLLEQFEAEYVKLLKKLWK